MSSSGAVDTGYAILTGTNGLPSFYTINLATGQATSVGAVGFTNQVYSLAVIPAPGAAAVLGLAMSLVGMRRRR